MCKDSEHPYFRLVGRDEKGSLHNRNIIVPRPEYLHVDLKTATFMPIEGEERQFYKVVGKGPRKVVLVMALAACHVQWEDQLRYFGVDKGDEFSVLVMDNRGVGFSGTPSGRWRTTDMAQDVWRVVEKLGWTGIHLAGLSMGGMIALEAALMRPDLLASLSLISTHGGGLGTIPPPHGFKTLMGCFASLGTTSAIDAGIDVMFAKPFISGGCSRPPVEPWAPHTRRFQIARGMLLRARCYVETGVFPEIRPVGLFKQLGAIMTHYISWSRVRHLQGLGIPVLVCSGKLDNLIGWWNSSVLSDALGGKHLHFPEGGHCVNEQYPEEVNAAMLETMGLGESLPPRKSKPLPPGWHPSLAVLGVLFFVVRIYTIVKSNGITEVAAGTWSGLAACMVAWRLLC